MKKCLQWWDPHPVLIQAVVFLLAVDIQSFLVLLVQRLGATWTAAWFLSVRCQICSSCQGFICYGGVFVKIQLNLQRRQQTSKTSKICIYFLLIPCRANYVQNKTLNEFLSYSSAQNYSYHFQPRSVLLLSFKRWYNLQGVFFKKLFLSTNIHLKKGMLKCICNLFNNQSSQTLSIFRTFCTFPLVCWRFIIVDERHVFEGDPHTNL